MKYIFLCFACLCATLSWAATIDEQRTTTGYGDTYQEALASALLEAVRQVRGLEIGTEKVLKTNIIQSTSSAGSMLQGSQEVATDIYTQSKGSIKTYKILKTTKPTKTGESWQVKALVTVPVLKEIIKNDRRKTMSILPFEIVPDSITSYKANLALDNITQRLADTISGEFNQSRKFAVLNRAFEKQFDKERALINSDKVSPSEASRLGRKLGADLIVLGKIYQLSFSSKNTHYYGVSSYKVEASIDMFYTVIEAATEKVMWSDTFTYKYKTANADEVVGEFISSLSSKIVTDVLDVIYPIKIMALAGEQHILLNQGGKRLKVGSVMAVFSKGRAIQDPDTGMMIKVDGKKVAELEVIQIKPKYSIAKLLPGTGEYAQLSVNAITRRTDALSDVTAPPRPIKALTPGSSDKPVQW